MDNFIKRIHGHQLTILTITNADLKHEWMKNYCKLTVHVCPIDLSIFTFVKLSLQL